MQHIVSEKKVIKHIPPATNFKHQKEQDRLGLKWICTLINDADIYLNVNSNSITFPLFLSTKCQKDSKNEKSRHYSNDDVSV